MFWIILIVVLFFVSVGYSMLMKKSFLLELEKPLELKQFRLSYGFGKVTVLAAWRSVPIEIEANPRVNQNSPELVYKMQHHATFTADIRPGAGIAAAAASAKAAQKAKEEPEEDSARPWRVKLTAEEQAVIDKRRSESGSVVEKPVALAKFNVQSNKPDEVTKYTSEPAHAEALETLFNSGFTLVQIDYAEIVAHQAPYGEREVNPQAVEKALKTIRDLLIGVKLEARS